MMKKWRDKIQAVTFRKEGNKMQTQTYDVETKNDEAARLTAYADKLKELFGNKTQEEK